MTALEGKFSGAAELFSNARRILMLPHPKGETTSISYALNECNLGILELEKINDELDDTVRDFLDKLQNLMDSQGKGSLVKAENMTDQEKSELKTIVDYLANWSRDRMNDVSETSIMTGGDGLTNSLRHITGRLFLTARRFMRESKTC